jgi:PhnB protein
MLAHRPDDGAMDSSIEPATGQYTTHGLPHGSTSITPHIVVTPASTALDFYATVLGARVEDVTRFGDRVAHAELDFGHGRLTLSDPIESYGLVAVDPDAGASYSLAVYVPDVDATVERAVAAGATVREPPATFVSGDRYASLLDPVGVRWTVMTRVEDISAEESRRRVAQWAAAQAGS